MPAQCAACLGMINKHDRDFVLEGTECFHRRCVTNSPQSIKVRQQHRINELETRNAHLDANAAYHQRRAEDALRELGDATRKVIVGQAAKDAVARSEQYWRERAESADQEKLRLANELADTRAQRDAARRDLQLAQVVRALTPEGSDTRVTPDEKDATEQRFELLELD